MHLDSFAIINLSDFWTTANLELRRLIGTGLINRLKGLKQRLIRINFKICFANAHLTKENMQPSCTDTKW